MAATKDLVDEFLRESVAAEQRRLRRGRAIAEILGAGLGAGLGLGLCLLVHTFVVLKELAPQYRLQLLFRSLYLQPIGIILGVLAVGMALLVSWSARSQTKRDRVLMVLRRMAGFWLGFVLGLVLFWLPLDYYGQVLSAHPSGKNLFQIYILGGGLWGLGIILGREAMAGFQDRTAPWRALLGGGLGGALGCVLAVWFGITPPLVETSGAAPVQLLEAILAGFGLGGGLALGWEGGARLWDWLQGEAFASTAEMTGG
jgi:hypothetical protein